MYFRNRQNFYRTCYKICRLCYTGAIYNPESLMQTITPMKAWMAAATVEEQELLAERAGTSRQYLYHLSAGNRTAGPETGAAIEKETKAMAKVSGGRLPVVYRTDLVPSCRACEFAQKCLGERAVISEFPIVKEDQGELPV